MRIEFVTIKGTWREVADAARTTINLKPGQKEPPSDWKRRMLLSEHSPIRLLQVRWKWSGLKFWISTHFVRHHVGIEHWVSTQRTDLPDAKTDNDRDTFPQGALVNHECLASSQALITLSRKRLCTHAGAQTRAAWQALLDALQPQEPELVSVCVRECVYRGFCPERKPCGYSRTPEFARQLAAYRGEA
jgi:hypothetical protein